MQNEFTPKCPGCGAAYEQGTDGWYQTCKGHSGWAVGPEGLNGPTIVSRPLCDWCGGRNVAHNLDGDNLCLPCCNKWARAEGIEALEARND
jgi:hypothetical protein